MDILYISRTKNIMKGWNNNKVVYYRTFESVESCKIMVQWARQYLKMYGSITESQLKMNLEYILKYTF